MLLKKRDVRHTPPQYRHERPSTEGFSGRYTPIEDHYRHVLGVSGSAGEEEIRAAYRTQLAKYHPDKVTHLGDEFYDLASRRTKEIIEAYEFFKRQYGFK